jgi:DNA-binding transcriptional LysR family regulator
MSLAADVRTLVNNAHSISSARASFDPASSTRVFRIAMTEYVGSVMLPHLAPEWEKAAPHVVIEIKPPPDDLEAGLERGEFDFIIVPASGMGETSYPSIELFRDEYVCVAAADNAGVSSPITLDEYLAAEHAAFLPHGMAVGDIVSRAGIARQIVAIASPTLLPSIIKGGRRVATIQRRLAMRVAGDLDLKISALPFDVPPLVAKAYWHPIRGEDLARVWFRNLLLTCSREINALSG